MTNGAEGYVELVQRSVSRQLTNELYHYTSADVAIYSVLRSGEFRLSPFESTNDLWESRPLHPSLEAHGDDRGALGDTNTRSDELWSELDRNIRLHAKVGCFTQDLVLSEEAFDADAFRGWSHLSLWAHYGQAHSGICLRFDRQRLVSAFNSADWHDALKFNDSVSYWSSSRRPVDGVDIGQVREFGVDAVALHYARVNSQALFFSKHIDWANEMEYRLVVLDQSVLPLNFDVRDALTGVYLGDAFPDHKLPALGAVLKSYPGVEVNRLRYHARQLHAWPAADSTPTPNSWVPHRIGTLVERLRELEQDEDEAARTQLDGEQRMAEALDASERFIEQIVGPAIQWPATKVQRFKGISAIPERQRKRRPGVPGEVVHAQGGRSAVITPDTGHWPSFVVCAAVQALPHQTLRLYFHVVTERHPEVQGRREVLLERARTLPDADAPEAVESWSTTLADELNQARGRYYTELRGSIE